ncbi:MAG: amidohydrolase family protein [Dehalococcoidia bacterium]|jgi:predicted TIM-barrel fold metal-dependent hydrolase|nr:amidohydrolase family protein [Dehalococcoidia bacterium]MDP7090580.1 amidohydrolase family protein [Dehalococcoidia bacterium]MDP7262223.1 amidohydrolase family protein [Dehalococcoidia bacterium]MDP7486167.1 amidohydrolase family protein [Dehalococcoidia bacterium]|tara:strand:+ start:1810 stop:2634 length:825 start_codon:yes stop_codon:yes gene_type:complete
MNIIDAHPHIYSDDLEKYPTIDDPWQPGEPATAEDLKSKMDDAGVGRAVFIQTSTFYGWDNRYVMNSTRKYSEWATGVITLSPDDPQNLEVLEDAAKNYSARGLRGTSDQNNQIGSPNVRRLWSKARDLGMVVNCMVLDDLERLYEIELMARQLDDLNIVIDHCFMLNTVRKTEETIKALQRLAPLPNVHAKLTSGTHGSARVYPHEDMHDPLKRVIESFTPDRCAWGSNFPNALWSKGTSYAQNLSLFTEELGLSQSDQEAILGGTAVRLWFS